MQVLITGSNGFIGSFLVEKCLERDYNVRCLVRQTSDLTWLKDLDIEYFYGELLHPESLVKAVKNVDLVFHLGGVTKAKDPQDYFNGNCQATVNLLDACLKYGPQHQKFVYVSSQAAGGPSLSGQPRTELDVPHPISLYGRSKLEAEKAVIEHGQYRPVTIIRPPSVYGPRDKDIFVMFKNVQKGIFPVPGFGRQRLSMIHVFDLVEGLLLASGSEKGNGEIFYMSGDEEYTLMKIGKCMAASLDKYFLPLFVPFLLLDAVSWINIFFSKIKDKPALLNRDKVREMKQDSWLCSNLKANKELGFQPNMTIENGFKQTVAWYKEKSWF